MKHAYLPSPFAGTGVLPRLGTKSLQPRDQRTALKRPDMTARYRRLRSVDDYSDLAQRWLLFWIIRGPPPPPNQAVR